MTRQDLFLPRIFDNAKKYGERNAYRVYRNDHWEGVSWNQFYHNIGRVASALLSRGLIKGDMVALYAPNCPEWTEIDYAAMALQVVTVAVHATSSTNAVTQMLQETTPKIVFAGNAELVDNVIASGVKTTIVILEGEHAQATPLKEFLNVPFNENWQERVETASPEDLWTIVYTSGTTGEVRGAMLTQANLVHQIACHRSRLPDVNDGDASFCMLPLSHIFERGWSAIQYTWGLTHHYCQINPEAFKLLATARPAVICLVPRVLEKVYSAIQDGFAKKPKAVQALLRVLINAAKAYRKALVEGRTPSPWLKLKNKLADKIVLSKIRALFGGRIKHCVIGSAALATPVHEFFRACGIFINCGYGLTETTATVSSTPLGYSIPSTVGVPMDGIEIRLGRDNEIQIKGPIVMQGYYKKPEATAEVFTKDGFFRTGDVGKLSPEGYLCITDRLKDLIRTSTGKYVAPQYLESRIAMCPFIEQAAVVGEGRSWLGALLVPNYAKLEEYAHAIGLAFSSRQELVTCPEIVSFIKKNLDELLSDVARHERVQRIALLAQPFTIQTGELTPTLKLRRKIICEHYRDIIAAMDAWGQSKSPLLSLAAG